jgi:hypothetical protein
MVGGGRVPSSIGLKPIKTADEAALSYSSLILRLIQNSNFPGLMLTPPHMLWSVPPSDL